ARRRASAGQLAQDGVGEAGPRLLRPLAERARREGRARDATVGVDPDERPAAAEMAVPPRRGQRARPVPLVRTLELDAEPPVERAEAAEVGEHAVEARELDARHLLVGLRRHETG